MDTENKTICNLIFPQPENIEHFTPNERMDLLGDIFITSEGNLHSGCNGGTAIFRSPTTPKLEHLYGLNESIFIEIVYAGALNVQLWAYPYCHSGRLMDEQAYCSRGIQTVHMPVPFAVFSEGYFDIQCRLFSECAVFSMSVISKSPQSKRAENYLTTLSRYVFPQKNICTEELLYFRADEKTSYYSYIDQCISISPYACVEFSTYFNAFSCGKWVKNTIIEDIYCNINLQGTCIVEVWHTVSEGQQYKVYSEIHENSVPDDICLNIGRSDIFDSGVLYLKIYALSETRIYGGSYATSTPKIDDVRLGIVITTYKREEDVKKAVASLVATLPSVLHGASVEIVVVDNGQTLQAGDVAGATLIPNRNVGGSGGFMRGLIHLEDEKRFTHCLFMDDDAFCEPESVARAHALLSFRREDNLAVAGAMLLQENMHIQHENGAYFDYTNHPIGCGLDLNLRENVVQNEQSPAFEGMYGAWWFFAFPIAHIKHYAFPFFVKGDDILFSLSNRFKIVTMNGICSWQEDFTCKHRSVSIYLGIRSILLINSYVNRKFWGRLCLIFRLYTYILYSSLAYNYCEAKVITIALRDFMHGPSMWVENIDMSEKIGELKRIDEKMAYSTVSGRIFERTLPHASPFRGAGIFQLLIVIFTVNGHLLPNFLLSKFKSFLYFNERYWLSAILGKKNIVIFNASNHVCYTLERSMVGLIKSVCLFAVYAFGFIFTSGGLYSRYKREFCNMTSRIFWINKF